MKNDGVDPRPSDQESAEAWPAPESDEAWPAAESTEEWPAPEPDEVQPAEAWQEQLQPDELGPDEAWLDELRSDELGPDEVRPGEMPQDETWPPYAALSAVDEPTAELRPAAVQAGSVTGSAHTAGDRTPGRRRKRTVVLVGAAGVFLAAMSTTAFTIHESSRSPQAEPVPPAFPAPAEASTAPAATSDAPESGVTQSPSSTTLPPSTRSSTSAESVRLPGTGGAPASTVPPVSGPTSGLPATPSAGNSQKTCWNLSDLLPFGGHRDC